jgi:hypothetical protein
VFDNLTPEQVGQLQRISETIVRAARPGHRPKLPGRDR